MVSKISLKLEILNLSSHTKQLCPGGLEAGRTEILMRMGSLTEKVDGVVRGWAGGQPEVLMWLAKVHEIPLDPEYKERTLA